MSSTMDVPLVLISSAGVLSILGDLPFFSAIMISYHFLVSWLLFIFLLSACSSLSSWPSSYLSPVQNVHSIHPKCLWAYLLSSYVILYQAYSGSTAFHSRS